ncbi:iron uptake porin [Synechococcus sp. UW140]|uniref:iron uptake porin n=1 Tax=Synechococcus sp. UW140 TaxID=368503 RepID=UPI000E0E6AF1|nr:iron uptake porin [Synechococcus sp. UW140]
MKLFKRLLLAPAGIGSLAVGVYANPLSITGVSDYAAHSYLSSGEQVTSITQFSDVVPTDWAYQALSNLIERYGCVAGYPNGTYRGNRAMTRFEAAALLNACLDRITEVTDELKRLMKEFEPELAILKGRVDGLEARVGELEATQFATTTKLEGLVTFVIGANRFGGNDQALAARPNVDNANREYGATTFNYDALLALNTSFTGKDNLIAVLRSGNFDGDLNAFGGAFLPVSTLETAFQEGETPNYLVINKLFYTFPIGSDFVVTAGGLVGQEDMLGFWPSVYPSDPILDVLTLNGAPGAYNKTLGAGAGLTWSRGGVSVTANYVAANGNSSNAREGGMATDGSAGSGTVQLGFEQEQWGIAAIYSSIQNTNGKGEANGLIASGTQFVSDSYEHAGSTSAFGLSGYWQPEESGLIPSISLGWGINQTTYDKSVYQDKKIAADLLVSTSQSWSVGLNWSDVFLQGNHAGMAVGQPIFATALVDDSVPRDGNYVWEWWYQFMVSDNISVTPGLFYLSRPLGQETSEGKSFSQLGALVKTSFSF